METHDTPPQVPDAPSRIPYATPVINEEDSEMDDRLSHRGKLSDLLKAQYVSSCPNICQLAVTEVSKPCYFVIITY